MMGQGEAVCESGETIVLDAAMGDLNEIEPRLQPRATFTVIGELGRVS